MPIRPDLETSPDDAASSEGGRWLRIAAIGSTLLAIPGAMGAAGLILLFFLAASDGAGDTLLIASGLLAPVVGFRLLIGYRGEVGSPAKPASRGFWWLSAAYNAAGVVLSGNLLGTYILAKWSVTALWFATHFWWISASGIEPVFSAPVLVWTGFMTVLSVSRARRRGVSTGGGAADQ